MQLQHIEIFHFYTNGWKFAFRLTLLIFHRGVTAEFDIVFANFPKVRIPGFGKSRKILLRETGISRDILKILFLMIKRTGNSKLGDSFNFKLRTKAFIDDKSNFNREITKLQ